MSKEIELKIQEPHFSAIKNGLKKCEVRKEDEYKFLVGDVLILCLYNPKRKTFSGAYVKVKITHILRDLRYTKPKHAILSFELLEVNNAFRKK